MTTKILFVDDDESLLAMYRTVLPPKYHYMMTPSSRMDEEEPSQNFQKQSNYQVITCNNGEEAIRIVRDYRDRGDPISIAFIDYVFPEGIDGVTIANEIKAIDDKIEIVYATSSRKIELLENSVQQMDGEVVYFSKPFDVNELIGLISRLLNKRLTARHAL